MKKYLMTGVAALALCAGFTACSHDDFTFSEEEYVQNQKEMVYAQYQQAFINAFGEPAKNHTWGFQMPSTTTRAITINGDNYDAFTFPTAEELAAAFPTEIPGGATEMPRNGDWNYFKDNGAGYNYQITATGEYNIGGGWYNVSWVSDPSYQNGGYNDVQYFNVYVNVDGDVTLKRNGSPQFNLYILKGNVTLASDFDEMAGTISVASGATLNDNRDHIASNFGVKVFNRGTVKVGEYMIGNNAKIFNESIFTATGALEYSAGSNNPSYFYNLGDNVRLTAPSMTLNSTCNFFSDGIVDIEGATYVTKDGIVWINNGHYTTGSFIWSAKNATFYNYCQLFVEGEAHMFDGEFNMMANSYMEAETAELDNYIVNMYGNSGINIKGNTHFIAQGDGTYQGFYSKGTNSNYLMIGGTAKVDCHKKTLSVSSGITYSFNELIIDRYGTTVTEAQLQTDGSGDYPVLDLQGTECPFGQLTVIPNTDGCGADWIEPNVKKVRVICEDMFAQEKGDFDFNDAVFDLTLDENGKVTWIDLIHTGAEFDIYVDGKEIHDALGLPKKSFGSRKTITADNSFAPSAGAGTKYPVEIEVYAVRNFTYTNEEGEKVTVNDKIELKADQGKAPGKIQVKSTFEIPAERVPIDSKYESFKAWVQDASIDWEE